MNTTPDPPERLGGFAFLFRNPFLSLLKGLIWLALYPFCWLWIQLHRIKQQLTPTPLSPAQTSFYTKGKIKRALHDNNIRSLTTTITLGILCVIMLGRSVLMIVTWFNFPLTALLIIVSTIALTGWLFGFIAASHYRLVGTFCILMGILGGIVAVCWPQNLSEYHWDWVLALIAGGAIYLWQSWKKPKSSAAG